jgi:tetratricopeptide (TPR) repeat protein
MQSLSVIVTAYNCAPFIRRALRSVEEAVAHLRRCEGLAAPPVELIVVDDGSTDGTPQEIAAFVRPHGPWELVRHDQPSSPSFARNAGARRSTGDLLCFLDGDDLFLPEHLHACWQALRDPAVDFVKTGVRLADPVHPDWVKRIEHSLPINLCVRRRCHEEFGGFPDQHLFDRNAEGFAHRADVFYKFEDMFYNELLSRLFRGTFVARETVESCRHPGNGYDRQYAKFCRPFAGADPTLTDDERLRLDLADVLTRHRTEEVLRRRAASAAPGAENVALARAGQRQRAGDLAGAEALCRQALQENAADAGAWRMLGQISLASGQNTEATDAFRRAAQLSPGDADAHAGLAQALAAKGDRVRAIESYRRALQCRPDHAEALAGLGLALAERGQAAEAVDHFRRAVAIRPEAAPTHHNLAVALANLGDPTGAEAAFREAVRLRPDYAAAHYGLGNVLRDRGRRADALASYREALRIKPDYADAYNNLGLALLDDRQFEEAAATLRQGLRLRPQAAEAHNNLGLALAELGRFAEAEACYHEALRLNPAYTEAHSNLANAHKEQGRLTEAQAGYQIALWHSPDQPSSHWNRSLAWLQAGEYEKGWAEYEWRWKRPQARLRKFPQPVWDGAPLAGRTLLLHMEQGLGDMIQFIRYAALVRGGRVVVECPGMLVPLFSSCAGIDRLVAEGDSLPPFDVHLPLMSLPHRLGTTLETVPASVPYLSAMPERVTAWRRELENLPGFRVGVVWQGNPHHQWDRHRSVPLTAFAPLTRVPGVRLISLQRGPGTEQLHHAGLPSSVHQFSKELDAEGGAFLDVGAVMKNLDLVVTVDTAAAHLAGALGVPAWVALAAISDWRWLTRCSDSPWYPTLRLFRQRRLGDWGPVFRRIAAALRPLVKRQAVDRPA